MGWCESWKRAYALDGARGQKSDSMDRNSECEFVCLIIFVDDSQGVETHRLLVVLLTYRYKSRNLSLTAENVWGRADDSPAPKLL